MESPAVGSLVVPSPSYREALKTGEGAALLLGLRRGSGHLFYPATDRSFWIPMRDVRAIPAEAVPGDSLESLLSRLLLFLEAEECTVEDRVGDTMNLVIEHPGASRERLRELAGLLGERLSDYAYEPGSMRAVVLRLALSSLPAAAGEGR